MSKSVKRLLILSTILFLAITVWLSLKDMLLEKKFNTFKNDPLYFEASTDHRFIAHAGGTIDLSHPGAYMYTNSKEALDSSYKRGFRMFELDIITTKDDTLVAVHDWEWWKIITKKNSLNSPISYRDFMASPLFEKFTPLDMSAINSWFKQHPDAILVTDKINDPIRFSKAFHFPDRLIMELHTLEAVKEGLQIDGLTVMPNEEVLKQLSFSDLIEMKISHITVSRRFIEDNKPYLLELKQNGIRVYVFHVNYDGIDEEYVVNNELKYVYGMYADKWVFPQTKYKP